MKQKGRRHAIQHMGWCHLEVGEIVLRHIQAPPDLFFIHWYLKEVSVNEEGFLTAVAEHPSAPQSNPHVESVIGPLTGYLVAYHDGTERFTLLGKPMSAPITGPSWRKLGYSSFPQGNSHSPHAS